MINNRGERDTQHFNIATTTQFYTEQLNTAHFQNQF